MNQRTVSCVIAAFNEAERIGDVLKAVEGHPLVSEVVVVDDGSSDGTAEVVRTFSSVKLVINEVNMGKSASLVRGVAASSGEFILMLDADLRNLTRDNISALIEPVLGGRADFSMSLRGNSLPLYKAIGIDFVSGERVLPRTLITDHAEEIRRLSHFGVESFMNKHIIAKRMRIAIVRLDNLINFRKKAKIGWWRGTLKELGMVRDILKVISPVEVLRQNYAMLRLSRLAGAKSPANASAERSQV